MATNDLADELTTGIKFMDSDHHELIRLTGKLIVASDSGDDQNLISYRINKLIVFTRKHFDREEEAMRRVKFPDRKAHVAEHTKLLEEVLELKQELEGVDETSPFYVHVFMNKWLHDHILNFDVKLAKALNDSAITEPRIS